jgi:wyosine [tRNA(Phe)-imidazoG37] synthetase (radical SAM superfamily)
LTARDESRDVANQAFPSVEEIAGAVRAALDELERQATAIDSLTVTGNGEMTLHPRSSRSSMRSSRYATTAPSHRIVV